MSNIHGGRKACESVRELLSPYMDGRTTAAETRRLEEHLVGCPACQQELAQLRLVVQGLHALPQIAAPRSFALPASTARAPRVPFLATITYLRTAAATLAACLVILVGASTYLAQANPTTSAVSVAPSAFSQPREGTSDTRRTGAVTAPAAAPAPAAASAPPGKGAGEPEPTAAPAAPLAAPPAQGTPQPHPAAAPQAPAVPTTAAAPAATAAPAAQSAPPTAAAGQDKALVGSAPANAEEGEAPSPTPATRPAASESPFRATTAGEPSAAGPNLREGLWTAEVIVAISLLLAAVGAFLGPRGGQHR